MFNTLSIFQKKLVGNELNVLHKSSSWTASFEWFEPANLEQIQQVEQQLSLVLPQDYKKFLKEISNGAILFYDKEYGQWGFRLFGTTEIVKMQTKWKNSLLGKWKAGLIAYGELFGEANALVFDLSKPTKDSGSCRVLESSVYDEFEDWRVLSRSFHEWIEHLILAQGNKYWLWF